MHYSSCSNSFQISISANHGHINFIQSVLFHSNDQLHYYNPSYIVHDMEIYKKIAFMIECWLWSALTKVNPNDPNPSPKSRDLIGLWIFSIMGFPSSTLVSLVSKFNTWAKRSHLQYMKHYRVGQAARNGNKNSCKSCKSTKWHWRQTATWTQQRHKQRATLCLIIPGLIDRLNVMKNFMLLSLSAHHPHTSKLKLQKTTQNRVQNQSCDQNRNCFWNLQYFYCSNTKQLASVKNPENSQALKIQKIPKLE
jgi:hypothetical protein